MQLAESLHSEMQSFHPIRVLQMLSRNRISFPREFSPFKALEFMKNLEAPGKCEASGEVKWRQYTQKGIYPTDFGFPDLPVYLHVL